MTTVVGAKPIFKDKRRRVWELDFLRGLAVILMCFDHLMFDLAYLDNWFYNFRTVNNGAVNAINELAVEYWQGGLHFYGHHIFVFVFLFLVGTSCAFSRDNVRRGAGLGVIAVAFTGVTFVLREFGIMDKGIVFGILDCIALSILCAAAVDGLTKPVKPLNVYLPLVLGACIMFVGIYKETWNIRYDRVFDADRLLDYIIGVHAYGDDWFGLFPNVGAVLIGMYWGKAAYASRASLLPRLDGKWNKPFRFVGSHALIVYLVHQVALAGIVCGVCLCLGYRF